MLVSFFSGEFLLHIPCRFLFFSRKPFLQILCWLHFYLGSFSYISHACFSFLWEFLLYIPYWLLFFFFFIFFFFFFFFFFNLGSFSYTPRAGLILSGDFLLHIPCWLHFYFLFYLSREFPSHIPCTHPVLASFLSGEFLLHIPCWRLFFFLSGEFLLHIPCWLHFYLGSFSHVSRAGFFFFIWRVFLTHPVLASFLSGEFL